MSKQQFGIFICSCLSPSRSEDALICSLFHPRWQIGSSVLCSEAVTASRLPGGLFHTSLEITCFSLIYGRQMLCKLLPAQGWKLSLPGLPRWHLLQPQLEMGEGSAPANPEQGQQGSGMEHGTGLLMCLELVCPHGRGAQKQAEKVGLFSPEKRRVCGDLRAPSGTGEGLFLGNWSDRTGERGQTGKGKV